MTKIYRELLKPGKFRYVLRDGSVVREAKILEWIDRLRIPPAWTDVEIYYNVTSKQTVCGKDDKMRLQCLYSDAHKARARKLKYCGLIAFGQKLPAIQGDIRRLITNARLSKQKIIALILLIVQSCSFRLGTLRYESQNDSYGITTIRKRHLKFVGKTVHIRFIGKKGVENECVVTDQPCVEFLKELYNLVKPDDHIMMYRSLDSGDWAHIKHTDVNKFLRTYGETITSKDFRTFQSNMYLIDALKQAGDPNKLTRSQRKKLVVGVVKDVAERVHNTPAICKKEYIDSEIIDMYLDHPVKYRKMFVTPELNSRLLFIKYLETIC